VASWHFDDGEQRNYKLMRNKRTETAPTQSSWQIAFFPTFALLGAVLPIGFLTGIEQYLYYLQPLELIPTYGTAWLLLAVLAIPLSLLCGLVLEILDRAPSLRILRTGLVIALVGIAAATTVGVLTYAAVLWLRTFGVLVGVPVEGGTIVFSIVVVALIAITRRGRRISDHFHSTARWGAALGALALLSLPFSGWSHDTKLSRTEQPRQAKSLPSRPHILLVTIDTLSAQHMSLYGAPRETTPSLEAFARTATTFDRAYANANFTTAGIASILTATRPWTHRAIQLQSWPMNDARRNSLPALLQQAGYQTGYVATNPLASPARNGMGSYFDWRSADRFPALSLCLDRLSVILPYDCAATVLSPFTFVESLWSAVQRICLGNSNWYYDPRVASQAALDWLANVDKTKPIFLWVHYMPPHAPYAAPAPWLGQFDASPRARDAAHSEPKVGFLFADMTKEDVYSLSARYDESVKYVDHYVGEFIAHALQALGENTAVIITADHGESLEHGYGTHAGPGLFEPIIHIPLLIKLPSQTQALRVSSLAEQIDIAPTLADLASFTPPSSWEGRSLLDVSRSSQAAPSAIERPAFAMNFEENSSRAPVATGSIAVIDGRWKLVCYMGALHYARMPKLHDELYDLAADPAELTNQISHQPDEAARLRKLIDTELAVHGAAVP
jgi:arylsulfatase A-like enzyme